MGTQGCDELMMDAGETAGGTSCPVLARADVFLQVAGLATQSFIICSANYHRAPAVCGECPGC